MSDGKGLLNIKRRLSAPGRRKSEGIELKPENVLKSSKAVATFVSSAMPTSAKRTRHSIASIVADKHNREVSHCTSSVDPMRRRSVSDAQTTDSVSLSLDESVSVENFKFRASAIGSTITKIVTKDAPNFRAPIRSARSDETVTSYPCDECRRFADLLRSESVCESVIKAAFKHRYFCAPTNTPPNLWEPWDLNTLPLSLTPEARDM